MILVADSGSTKADWVIVDKTASMQKFSSAGFNPYFHDHAYILKELHANSGLQTIASQIKEVYFSEQDVHQQKEISSLKKP